MPDLIRKPSVYATLALLCLGLATAKAQTKPPESTSKVKKVLLYNKIGGWQSADYLEEVKAAFTHLSESKGFELVQTSDVTVLTLDYLKQFQAIVWNNNTNGAGSVPSAEARQAVIDYLERGGGWLLLGMAGDHANSWPALAETMGTSFIRHAKNERAETVLDTAARAHMELKWMVEGFPDVIVLKDIYASFTNTVRPLPGVTVVATTRDMPGIENVITPVADGSGDNVYIWAREVGRGRFFHNAIGYSHSLNQIMAQQDSIVPKLYWEHLRYLAGDYQNGCTTPSAPGFDPNARVHDEAMCATASVNATPARSHLVVSKGNLRWRLTSPEGPLRARLHDLRGRLVWERALPAWTGEIILDGALERGLCHIELQGTAGTFRSRLLLP
jgi:type 1 glutamine amidotransferase